MSVRGALADLELDSQAGVGLQIRKAGPGMVEEECSTRTEGGSGQVLGVSGLQSAYQEGRTQAVLLKPLVAADLLQYNSKQNLAPKTYGLGPKPLSPWLWSPSSAEHSWKALGEERAGLRSSGSPMPASAHVSWIACSLGWGPQGLHPSGRHPWICHCTFNVWDRAWHTVGAQYMFVI